MAHIDTDEILQLIVEVAAEVIVPRFKALSDEQVEQKSPGDFVTIADREAEARITERLLARQPGALVVGEEATFADRSRLSSLADAELAFTVDPVDGTANFVKGSPRYAVMVAEVRRGETTRAWIWQPETGRAYVAELGAGLYCNGGRVSRGPAQAPPRGMTSKRSWRQFDARGELDPILHTNFCAGFDYAQLVTGEVDFFTYLNPWPWDHLPGSLMLREVGGVALDAGGEPYGPATGLPNSLVTAASEDLARRLVGYLRHTD
jgi:fructose-1,6-bisphosphatase/inositol monophosphatase family enzyme